jgi:hypothetical protein
LGTDAAGAGNTGADWNAAWTTGVAAGSDAAARPVALSRAKASAQMMVAAADMNTPFPLGAGFATREIVGSGDGIVQRSIHHGSQALALWIFRTPVLAASRHR